MCKTTPPNAFAIAVIAILVVVLDGAATILPVSNGAVTDVPLAEGVSGQFQIANDDKTSYDEGKNNGFGQAGSTFLFSGGEHFDAPLLKSVSKGKQYESHFSKRI